MTNERKKSMGELPEITIDEFIRVLCGYDGWTEEGLRDIEITMRKCRQSMIYHDKLNGIAERFLQDCRGNGLYRHEIYSVMKRVFVFLRTY